MNKLLLRLPTILLPFIFGCLMLAGLLFGLQHSQARAQQAVANSLIWPISGSRQPDTDLISSPFGPRWQASEQRYDYHPGLDIVAPLDTPIHVITDGVVTEVGWLSPSSGLSVIVSHPQADYRSAYLHLNSTPAYVGQVVSQGEIIGYVGDSGETDFVHLHFEIRVNGQDYPANTRNPMGYLPRPEVTTPSIQIITLVADPVYSPTVTFLVTATRAELDVNQLGVIVQDRATGELLDNQYLDFNLRYHTGDDSLNQDGIQLTPSHFNTSTLEYELTANFYQLVALDAFTLTAQVTDLYGNTSTAFAEVDDITPPGRVSDLAAHYRDDGSIDLSWIAPGDNGFRGLASSYDIRFASSPIDSFSWYSATPLTNPPIPLAGGMQQIWNIPGPWSQEVYFALKTQDDEQNVSLVSNSAQALLEQYIPIVSR